MAKWIPKLGEKYIKNKAGIFPVTPSRIRAAKRKGKDLTVYTMTPSRLRALKRKRGY